MRFTAWLSDAERAGLQRLADEQGTSVNFVLRMLVRNALDMTNPHSLLHPATIAEDVTAVTRNK